MVYVKLHSPEIRNFFLTFMEKKAFSYLNAFFQQKHFNIAKKNSFDISIIDWKK